MDTFIENHNLLNLAQKEIESLNNLKTIKDDKYKFLKYSYEENIRLR